MKVVTHSKSKKTTNLEYSCVYCNAKKRNQNYLFVTEIRKDYIVLNDVMVENYGDFYLACDFETVLKINRNIKLQKICSDMVIK